MQQIPLRIAVVSPLFESVPPKRYGGTGRVISWLTEELVRQGHFVTLFASGDSITRARLKSSTKTAIQLDPQCPNPWPAHVVQLDEIVETASQFDVIHFHTDHWHLPFARHFKLPAITTLHGRLDLPELVPLYRRFADAPLVSVSESQRAPLGFANWIGTVLPGLPADLFEFSPGPGAYLAFLGRMSPDQDPVRAIRIARAAGLPLRMAARVDEGDEAYFRSRVRPLLGDGVEFAGEVADSEKAGFLGNASALLFTGEEPAFSLEMIESMACGTPVIAFNRGSAPELLQHAVGGCLVEDEGEAVEAARRSREFDRQGCRSAFEDRFTAERMAREYLQLYRGVSEVHQLAKKVAASKAARRALHAPEVPALRASDPPLAGLDPTYFTRPTFRR